MESTSIYNNPSMSSYVLFNANGYPITYSSLSNPGTTFDLRGIPSGIYYVRIDNSSEVKKIIHI